MLVKAITLGLVFTVGFSFSTFAAVKGQINGTNVNIRTANSTTSSVAFKLNKPDTVTVDAKNGDFYKVSVNGTPNLYVASSFVNITEADAVINAQNVNVRALPNTSGKVLGRLNNGDAVTITASSGSWYVINYQNQPAYISKEFVSGQLLDLLPAKSAVTTAATTAAKTAAAKPTSPPQQMLAAMPLLPMSGGIVKPQAVELELDLDSRIFAVTNSSGINFRKEPSTSAAIISTLPKNIVADVTDVTDEWIGITFLGKTGYISAQYVTLSMGVRPEPVNGKALEVIEYAKQFLGTPYKWAGTDLKKGVDCSGFVYSVFKNNGITVNRSSREQAKNGSAVAKNELIVGDLVFFDTEGKNNGGISHVGIYIGDGQFIHSSSSKRTWGVVISSLSEPYYVNAYVKAGRVIN